MDLNEPLSRTSSLTSPFALNVSPSFVAFSMTSYVTPVLSRSTSLVSPSTDAADAADAAPTPMEVNVKVLLDDDGESEQPPSKLFRLCAVAVGGECSAAGDARKAHCGLPHWRREGENRW